MAYLYQSNLDAYDRSDQLEITLDNGSTAILRRGHYYDLTAGELARARRYIVLVSSSNPADEAPIGVVKLPVKGNPTDGQVPVWSATNAAFVPGSGGGGGGGSPTGSAGGVLGGTYPNPTFAADMATQAELDAHIAATTASLFRGSKLSDVESASGQFDFDQVSTPSQPQADGFTSLVERVTSRSFSGAASLHCLVTDDGSPGSGIGYARGHFEIPAAGSTALRIGDELWVGGAYYFATGYFTEKSSSSDILRLDSYVTDVGGSRPQSEQQHLAIEMFSNDTLHVVANDRNGTVIEPFNAGLPAVAEGVWHWLELHLVLSPVDGNARTELYVNGVLRGAGERPNMFSTRGMFNRCRYGIVSTGGGETGTLEVWVDRCYISPVRRLPNAVIA